MAQTYLNKRRKDYLSCISGLEGYLEIMLDENDPCMKPYEKRIKTMIAYCKSIIRGMIDPLPIEQVRYTAAAGASDTDDRAGRESEGTKRALHHIQGCSKWAGQVCIRAMLFM